MSDFRIKSEDPFCPFCGFDSIRYLLNPMVPSSYAVCSACRARGPEVRPPFAPSSDAEMREAVGEAFLRFSARDSRALGQGRRAMEEQAEPMRLI